MRVPRLGAAPRRHRRDRRRQDGKIVVLHVAAAIDADGVLLVRDGLTAADQVVLAPTSATCATATVARPRVRRPDERRRAMNLSAIAIKRPVFTVDGDARAHGLRLPGAVAPRHRPLPGRRRFPSSRSTSSTPARRPARSRPSSPSPSRTRSSRSTASTACSTFSREGVSTHDRHLQARRGHRRRPPRRCASASRRRASSSRRR